MLSSEDHNFAADPAALSQQYPGCPEYECPDEDYRKHLWKAYVQLKHSDPHAAKLPAWTEVLLPEDDAGGPQNEPWLKLKLRPRLQAALASVTNYTPSKWLLELLPVHSAKVRGAGHQRRS